MILTSQQFAEVIHFVRNRVAATPGAEKRRVTRIELKSQIVIVPVDHGVSGERIATLTRDFSKEGVGLLSGVAFPKGQQFVAFLPMGESDTLFVLSEVTHCGTLVEGIFSLGCRFIQVLSKHGTTASGPSPASASEGSISVTPKAEGGQTGSGSDSPPVAVGS